MEHTLFIFFKQKDTTCWVEGPYKLQTRKNFTFSRKLRISSSQYLSDILSNLTNRTSDKGVHKTKKGWYEFNSLLNFIS